MDLQCGTKSLTFVSGGKALFLTALLVNFWDQDQLSASRSVSMRREISAISWDMSA